MPPSVCADSYGESVTGVHFRKITLHRDFYCEGASYGDLDSDGVADVVAGPHWYEGPDFSVRREIWAPREPPFDPRGYSDCFFQWVHDFDGDRRPDVLVVGFPGQDASWYENPGTAAGHWTRHRVVDVVDNESPDFLDLTGDGAPELLFAQGGRLGWAGPEVSDPRAPWSFHSLTEPRGFASFTHGLGTGDLDGDGRLDVLEAAGWWQQPASLAGDPVWTRHDQPFGRGGAQIASYDVDRDGDADVATTISAHDYGLSWFEQGAGGGFQERVIVSASPPAPDAEIILHEPHALAVADVDADGLLDIVTGERFWGHAPEGDSDFGAPGRLYWFRLQRAAEGVCWTPVLIDDDSGVGTQVTAGDVSGDSLVDVVVANKKGAFVFIQERAAAQ